MKIDCDGILVQGHNVSADESALTGESRPSKKFVLEQCDTMKGGLSSKLASPILVSGSNIASGEGYMICLAVGDKSYKGRLSIMIEQAVEDMTPL